MEVPLSVVWAFPVHMTTFLFWSVAASLLVSVKLTSYCAMNSIISLNCTLLYAFPRSIATA